MKGWGFTRLLVVVVACAGMGGQGPADGAAADVVVPQAGRRFEFPRDYGSHPEFRLEWWYVTGHLWDAASNRFGFQVTFFRRTAPPVHGQGSRIEFESHASSAFGNRNYLLAHT